MSAVVGIMNKQAIAIAADSAVTVNGKIFNSALKIFTLSKFQPVGIMIYSSGSFMSTPWETIIKVFRAELGDLSHPTVAAYSEKFIEFLHNKNFFMSEESQKRFHVINFFGRLFRDIYSAANEKVTDQLTIEQAMDQVTTQYTDGWNANHSTCPELETYSIDEFNQFLGPEFDIEFDELFTGNNIILSDLIKEKLRSLAHLIIVKRENYTYHTGLVFVGFGDDEIFPSLRAINVHFGIGNKLKYYETDYTNVTHEMGSAIKPFAQTEAMNTILMGIAPNLENIYKENFKQYIEKYNQRLIDIINPQMPAIAEAIKEIDIKSQVNDFAENMQQAKYENYINPLVDAVSNLSKEDLGEMAESLIYLTYLQKRITFAAEDVGGAVDVAVISKGDGFIWIKRKHYFKPELNQVFFKNY